MTAEENAASGDSHKAAAALTEEQKQFLAECEAEFADRYTEADQEFAVYKGRSSTPPIVDPWYNKPYHNFDWPSRSGQGGGRRHQNWSRNDRDYNHSGNGGGSHRQGERYYGHRHRHY